MKSAIPDLLFNRDQQDHSDSIFVTPDIKVSSNIRSAVMHAFDTFINFDVEAVHELINLKMKHAKDVPGCPALHIIATIHPFS